MLTPMPMLSRDERIRQEFERVGPMSMNRFALHCLSAGIWPDHEVSRFAVNAAQAICRKALKHPDASGLPFAGQTTIRDEADSEGTDGESEKAPLQWAQRSFWGYDDYALNIQEGLIQRDAIHFHVIDLADECRGRFGRAPLINDPQRPQERRHRAAD